MISSSVKNKKLRLTEDFSVVAEGDIIIVTVGTPLADDGEPDMSQIRGAAESIAPYVKNGQLVVLKSTLPPFTTGNIVAPILQSKADIMLAFSPERLAEGRAIQELESLQIVVGGVTQESTKLIADFWREALDIEVIEVKNAETAELVKLADNMWIDLNIALSHGF